MQYNPSREAAVGTGFSNQSYRMQPVHPHHPVWPAYMDLALGVGMPPPGSPTASPGSGHSVTSWPCLSRRSP